MPENAPSYLKDMFLLYTPFCHFILFVDSILLDSPRLIWKRFRETSFSFCGSKVCNSYQKAWETLCLLTFINFNFKVLFINTGGLYYVRPIIRNFYRNLSSNYIVLHCCYAIWKSFLYLYLLSFPFFLPPKFYLVLNEILPLRDIGIENLNSTALKVHTVFVFSHW